METSASFEVRSAPSPYPTAIYNQQLTTTSRLCVGQGVGEMVGTLTAKTAPTMREPTLSQRDRKSLPAWWV